MGSDSDRPIDVEGEEESSGIDRRTLIAGAAAAAAGLVGVMAAPSVALAANNDPVLVANTAQATGLNTALYGLNTTTPNGGVGVIGESFDRDGVQGFSHQVGLSGVWGKGYAAGSAGITGDGLGYGIHGRTATGYGVYGENLATPATTGIGVFGEAVAGVGVKAKATTGTALMVDGKVSLSRSGVVAVGKKKTYVTVTVPSGVSATSQFIATLQGNAGTGVGVAYAAVKTATTFRVYFTKKTTKATKVGWMVLG